MSLLLQISCGLAHLNISPSSDLVAKLEIYLKELMKWNRVFNLTAIRAESKLVSHHLLDSLAISPYISGEKIIDVGTGAGLPGLPLALLYPDKQFTLLDSNGRKTRFLQQIKTRLDLKNCHIKQSRVEDYKGCFDQLTCRAFASLTDIIRLCAHLIKEPGQILALKGKRDQDIETSQLQPFEIEIIHALDVPSVEAERHLLILRRRKP